MYRFLSRSSRPSLQSTRLANSSCILDLPHRLQLSSSSAAAKYHHRPQTNQPCTSIYCKYRPSLKPYSLHLGCTSLFHTGGSVRSFTSSSSQNGGGKPPITVEILDEDVEELEDDEEMEDELDGEAEEATAALEAQEALEGEMEDAEEEEEEDSAAERRSAFDESHELDNAEWSPDEELLRHEHEEAMKEKAWGDLFRKTEAAAKHGKKALQSNEDEQQQQQQPPSSASSSNDNQNMSGGSNANSADGSSSNNNNKNPPGSDSTNSSLTMSDIHDWGVDEFHPILWPGLSQDVESFVSHHTNALSAGVPHVKDVLFIGVNSRLVQLPGQPFQIVLPRQLLTAIRSQIAQMGYEKKRANRKIFLGLFFQKEKSSANGTSNKPASLPPSSSSSSSTDAPSESTSPSTVDTETTPSPSTRSSELNKSLEAAREALQKRAPKSSQNVPDLAAVAKQKIDEISKATASDNKPQPSESESESESMPESNVRSDFDSAPIIDPSPIATSTAAEAAESNTPPAPIPIVDLSMFEPVGLLAEVFSIAGDTVVALCHRRISLDTSKGGSAIAALNPNMRVSIKHHEDQTWSQLTPPTLRYNQELLHLKNTCLRLLRSLKQLEGDKQFQSRQKSYFTFNRSSPGSIIDFWCTLSSSIGLGAATGDLALANLTRQTLVSLNLIQRLKAVAALLQHELTLVHKQKRIEAATKLMLSQTQNEILNQQKKAIEDSLAKVQNDTQQLNKQMKANATGENTEQKTNAAGTTEGATEAVDLRTEKEKLLDKYMQRLKDKTVPAEILQVIEDEMDKFRSMDAETSFEYNNVRNYLDWLTILPWGVYVKETFDLVQAEKILNQDHYGMEEVKERILEFIATSKLVGTVPQGKILCLVGPPGVGKTSIGQSISRALGRPFHRISVGGLDDVSELKGHRRTYVGSLPGKLIQALKRVNASNPVLLLDEIDKLSRGGHRGDPAAAMLEVLDPEQNSQFQDHYMEVPVDLSKVLFICTANDRDQIPGPLADRMDFLELSGYLAKEKVSIAQEYLLPTIRKRTGVTDLSLQIRDDALFELIRWYCREAGVRSLQKYLEKIVRKVALALARESKKREKAQQQQAVKDAEILSSAAAIPMAESLPPVVVTPANLVEYAGQPNYLSDKLYETNPVGVSTGLAYSSNGGAVLFIESVAADASDSVASVDAHEAAAPSKRKSHRRSPKHDSDEGEEQDESIDDNDAGGDEVGVEADLNPVQSSYRGRGELFCTGQLGKVMKESSTIAYTVAKRILFQRTALHNSVNQYFDQHRIHLHLPAGATPKDGPSAGVALVTSLLSLALQTPMKAAIAMSGEITLTGKVLPVGGIKEKLMAAKHAGISTVILPDGNRKDVSELKPFIVEGMTIEFVQHYDHVFDLVFPHLKQAPVQLKPTPTPTVKNLKKGKSLPAM